MPNRNYDVDPTGEFWRFVNSEQEEPATGEFIATGLERLERAYFPLANEAGMRSWTSSQLQGSPAASFHEFLGFPLVNEDLPHCLVHRGFWLAEDTGEVFSLSNLSPRGLTAHLEAGDSRALSQVESGPGWFRLTRNDPQGRFRVSAALWCPAEIDEKLEFMWVKVVNTSRTTLKLHPYTAIPVFARSADRVRDHRHLTTLLHRYRSYPHGITVCPCMSFDERGHKINATRYTVLAFGPGGSQPRGIWRQQRDFLGEGGNYAAPMAVWRRQNAPEAVKEVTEGGEAVAGFRFRTLSLAPGKTAEFFLLAGISEDPRSTARWTRKVKASAKTFASESFESTKQYWQEKLARISFRTQDAVLNNWLTWVTFQPILRRIYGNSYVPELDYGRGGKGWRDLWQDCLSLLLSDPGEVRSLLMHNFGGIRIDGSNATVIREDGSFIADRNNIPRTWMDHGCWPAFTTLLYIDQTGDLDILLEPREYYCDHFLHRCKQTDPNWDESRGSLLRVSSGRVYRGSVLEHLLVQTLTAFFNVGEHNLCRLEDADWNDGMDMAPHRGESVAFSALYAWNLKRIASMVEALVERGAKCVKIAKEMACLLDRTSGGKRVNYRSPRAKQRRLAEYLAAVSGSITGSAVRIRISDLVKDLLAKSRDLSERIRTQEWVTPNKSLGYFNGYYDDHGQRVEGRVGNRLQMTLTGQVFPIAGGIATDEQIDDVIRAVDSLLRDRNYDGPRLNTNFGGPKMELGRAFGFLYGEKENGAVFSHMAVMYAYALYVRRHAEAGRKVWATLFRKSVDQSTARILPGLPEYFNANGRGLYCYLTGSAPWLIYLLVTQAFGVRGHLGDLVIDPQLTRDDFDDHGHVTVRVYFANRPLMITFENARFLSVGQYEVKSVLANDKPLPTSKLPDGGVRITRSAVKKLRRSRNNHLTVELGQAKPT